jgi:hypothetical protein
MHVVLHSLPALLLLLMLLPLLLAAAVDLTDVGDHTTASIALIIVQAIISKMICQIKLYSIRDTEVCCCSPS